VIPAPDAAWGELPVEITAEELGNLTVGLRGPVAVTGATGFVGSHFAETLVRGGIRPRLLVRDPRRVVGELTGFVDLVAGSLEDDDALGALVSGCGTLFHLAGVVRAGSAAEFDRGNRLGTERLVAALRRAAPAARLVHVSSLAAAGPSAEPAGKAPDEPAAPVSAYGRSKLGAETAARAASEWVIVRPPAIYGPRDTDVLQFFRLAARGLVPLPAGERWVTTAFVSDVVRALLAAGSGDVPGGRVLHVGDPRPMTMRSLIAGLAAAGGVSARVIAVPAVLLRGAGRIGDLLQRLGARRVALTSDKAGELLARHWTARTEGSLRRLGVAGSVPFAQGATATWAWYREHGWLPRAKMTGR
jgi:nucleoside-diphosphate-sugar epimerase